GARTRRRVRGRGDRDDGPHPPRVGAGPPGTVDVGSDGDGWWRAEVGDRLVGRIRVDAGWGGLAPTSVMWTERYAPPLRTCAELGHAVAWFGCPSADGGVVPVARHNHLAAHPAVPGRGWATPRVASSRSWARPPERLACRSCTSANPAARGSTRRRRQPSGTRGTARATGRSGAGGRTVASSPRLPT